MTISSDRRMSALPLPAEYPRVDGTRMLRRLDELNRFGAVPGGGITRTGLSAEENAARRYLAQQCHRDGLVTHVDAAGNLIMRRQDAHRGRRVVLLGSHLDTVTNGGRLDGAYGVIAAHEVLATLARFGPPLPFEPVAVAFTNEEGTTFPYPFSGSLGLVGGLDMARANSTVGHDGRSLREALRAAGGDLDNVADAAWSSQTLACYLELHIEQGPILEARQMPIGVVEAITGRTILDVTVRGAKGHAGTTPMSLRRDALAAAARVVLAVRAIAADRGLCSVSTVGCLTVGSPATNVIPAQVRLTAEFRDGRAERLVAAEDALLTELARIGADTNTAVEAHPRRVARPTLTDATIRQAVTAAADGLGLPSLPMFSGAGHDAQILADITPIGMIFVPSRQGVSHAPQEATDDVHLVAGADTLLHTVLRLRDV